MSKKSEGVEQGIEAETFHRVRRDVAQGFVLDDEISEAVKDGLAAVDLYAYKNVRAVAGKDVRAGVDAAMSEIQDEFRLLRDLRALLCGEPAFADHVLVVQAYDDPVGLATRFVNLSQIFLHVLFISGCSDVEIFAQL